jgi:hypothetical protein
MRLLCHLVPGASACGQPEDSPKAQARYMQLQGIIRHLKGIVATGSVKAEVSWAARGLWGMRLSMLEGAQCQPWGPAVADEWAAELEGEYKAHAKRLAAAIKERFHEKVSSAAAVAKQAFAFVRHKIAPRVDMRGTAEAGVDATQFAADKELQKWVTECWRPEAPAPPFRLPPDLGEHLAPVSVEELDQQPSLSSGTLDWVLISSTPDTFPSCRSKQSGGSAYCSPCSTVWGHCPKLRSTSRMWSWERRMEARDSSLCWARCTGCGHRSAPPGEAVGSRQ